MGRKRSPTYNKLAADSKMMQLENEILDFESKILKHARNPDDANALESIIHEIVERVMERHQIDKNDLAIKSEIISLVSYNLRKYERAYEEAHKQSITHPQPLKQVPAASSA